MELTKSLLSHTNILLFPSIALICEYGISKKHTNVAHAPKDSNQHKGIAIYSLTSELPDAYQEILPYG